jgi:hypothetical protein
VNRLEGALRALSLNLSDLGASWALVGGLAVSARTAPRFTRDVDLAVAVPDDRHAEELVHRLVQRGYAVLALMEQEAARRLATVRLAPPGETVEGVVVDLLFASSGIEREIAGAAEPLAILEGFVVPVAGLGHLLALKVLAEDPRRPQDRTDIRSLVEAAEPGDLEIARQSLALIEERGFHRDKRLLEEFEKLIG